MYFVKISPVMETFRFSAVNSELIVCKTNSFSIFNVALASSNCKYVWLLTLAILRLYVPLNPKRGTYPFKVRTPGAARALLEKIALPVQVGSTSLFCPFAF